MSDRETRFKAHTARKHQRAIGVVVLVLLIGCCVDNYVSGSFPSSATILFAVIVFFSFEIHAAFRGARSLGISTKGITLERSFGGKVLRLSWNEIKRAEARRSPLGLVWTFYTKEGRKIRWAQADFDGNRRLELEETLRNALQQNGVPLG